MWSIFLKLAIKQCRKEDVFYFLQQGMSPNGELFSHAKGAFLTPLMMAASKGDPEIVDMLLMYGADKNKKNMNGNTALDIAMNMKNHHLIKSLSSPEDSPIIFKRLPNLLKKQFITLLIFHKREGNLFHLLPKDILNLIFKWIWIFQREELHLHHSLDPLLYLNREDYTK